MGEPAAVCSANLAGPGEWSDLPKGTFFRFARLSGLVALPQGIADPWGLWTPLQDAFREMLDSAAVEGGPFPWREKARRCVSGGWPARCGISVRALAAQSRRWRRSWRSLRPPSRAWRPPRW